MILKNSFYFIMFCSSIIFVQSDCAQLAVQNKNQQGSWQALESGWSTGIMANLTRKQPNVYNKEHSTTHYSSLYDLAHNPFENSNLKFSPIIIKINSKGPFYIGVFDNHWHNNFSSAFENRMKISYYRFMRGALVLFDSVEPVINDFTEINNMITYYWNN